MDFWDGKGLVRIDISDGSLVDFCQYLGRFTMALNGFLGWFHGLIMTDISDGSLVDFCKFLGWFTMFTMP